MAQPSTIFKAELEISDMDRGYYNTHSITVARHPSETDERMMMRILAYALHASEALIFAGGLSSTDEPDLWELSATVCPAQRLAKDSEEWASIWGAKGFPQDEAETMIAQRRRIIGKQAKDKHDKAVKDEKDREQKKLLQLAAVRRRWRSRGA